MVFAAYLTFEQVETDLRARNAGLTSRLEDEFARLQARAAAGAAAAELEALHRALLADLERAERTVSDKGSGANLLAQSLLLLVREGFEAILIVGALMTFLGKAGAADRRHEVARGAWLAVAASAATAVVIELLFHVTPGQREALEGFTMLVAVAVLFYVSYWVLSKIEADRWNAFLKSKMQGAGLVGLTVLEGWPRWPQLGIYPTVQSLALQGVLVVLLVFGLAWSRLRRSPPRA